MTDLVLVKSDVKKIPVKVGRDKAANRDSKSFETAKAAFTLNGVRLDNMARVAELARYAIQKTLGALQPSSENDEAPFILSENARSRLDFAIEHLVEQIADAVNRYRTDQEYLDQL